MNWPMVGSWLRLVVCFWYHQKHLEAAPEEAQYSVHNGSALDYGENGCVSIIVKKCGNNKHIYVEMAWLFPYFFLRSGQICQPFFKHSNAFSGASHLLIQQGRFIADSSRVLPLAFATVSPVASKIGNRKSFSLGSQN